MKVDKSFDDFFVSFGVAIVTCTLLVSLGKLISYYYFIYISLSFLVLIVSLAVYEYYTNMIKQDEAREKQLATMHLHTLAKRRTIAKNKLVSIPRPLSVQSNQSKHEKDAVSGKSKRGGKSETKKNGGGDDVSVTRMYHHVTSQALKKQHSDPTDESVLKKRILHDKYLPKDGGGTTKGGHHTDDDVISSGNKDKAVTSRIRHRLALMSFTKDSAPKGHNEKVKNTLV